MKFLSAGSHAATLALALYFVMGAYLATTTDAAIHVRAQLHTALDADDGSWFPLSQLTDPSTPNTTFQSLLTPFFSAMRYSYTATYGGYYKPDEANATMPGYLKSEIESNPQSNCGMRALVFVEDLSTLVLTRKEAATRLPKIIVAFRGTDLSGNNPSTTCDSCADTILFNNVTEEDRTGKLPSTCAPFSWEQLDYYSQAVAFVRRVLLAYPASPVRFTGHSLGAALASAVSLKLGLCNHLPPTAASVNAGVIAVGTPGIVYPTLRRIGNGLNSSTFDASDILLLNQYYDTIYNSSVTNGLYGTLCLWNVSQPPTDACAQCFESGQNPVDTSDNVWCSLCMGQVHIYANYLRLLMGNSKNDFSVTMPVCYPAAPEPACLHGGSQCQGSGKCIGI